jgi:Uma2 family endonuclease
MSITSELPPTDRVILRDVSWGTYEHLLKDFEGSSSPRIAFDQGVMEIMSPFAEHERLNWLLSSIIQIVLEEMDLEFESLGHVTFKSDALKRAFEPDSCFYIRNVDFVRNKARIDLKTDPPPDLIVEIDLTSNSLDKYPIYSALRVPEVWRYEDSLEIMSLKNGRYVKRSASAALPVLTTKLVMDLVGASRITKRPAWLRQTRQQIRNLI